MAWPVAGAVPAGQVSLMMIVPKERSLTIFLSRTLSKYPLSAYHSGVDAITKDAAHPEAQAHQNGIRGAAIMTVLSCLMAQALGLGS
jgi:hypothetical protein